MKKVIIVMFGILIGNWAYGQEVELANEYFKQGEFEKAKELYQNILKDKNQGVLIHQNYLQCLIKLRDYETAEKFLKRQIKANEQFLSYKADYALLLETTGKISESVKDFENIVELASKTEGGVYEMQDYFYRNNKYDLIIPLLKRGRENSKNENKYAILLARAYLINGQKAEMVEEMLKYGISEGNFEYVKATFQDNLKTEAEIETLEKILYSKVQKYPNEQFYTEILIWHFIQQKEFNKAFIQTRALDRRNKLEGVKVFELAMLALQNKEYRSAIQMYEYIMKEYPEGDFYAISRRNAIYCKEEIVKNTYPVRIEDIKTLIADYDKLFLDVGRNNKTMEAMRNTAQLYAFYLNKRDTAVAILEKAIQLGGNDPIFRDKCKLDLGDIYILKDEPWEATLIYSQVEKSQKEDQLGQEAKLRNAKLHYFNGEFELAKEILDILKKATTREIANDAMQLSLLIQDNTGLDSTETAMRKYAAIELQLFQNKTTDALAALDSMILNFKSHSLADELLWLRANVYVRINDMQKAVADLENIRANYAEEILGDDATFLLAKSQESLGNRAKAMELYKEILTKYSGSIYSTEARKRFRNLRGDIIN